MNLYRIYKNKWSTEYKANTIEEAQVYANSIGVGYSVELIGVAPQVDPRSLLDSDKEFLAELMNEFILQNRLDGITPLESSELLTAFNSIKQLSEVGAVPEVYASIDALVPPIGRVYTEARKQDDLNKISQYLATR